MWPTRLARDSVRVGAPTAGNRRKQASKRRNFDLAATHRKAIMNDAERSFRDLGFLSPVVSDFVASHRASQHAWFTLAEQLNVIGQSQCHRGCEKAGKLSSLDPLNVGVRLLIRTMSNFQGSVILTEKGMEVEALTLVRNCYENGFWIGALVADPTAAITAFKLDETKSQDSRADAFVRIVEKHGDDAMKMETKQQFAKRRAKSRDSVLGLETLAKLAGLHPNYVFYKEVSANAAHPSLNSIDRYLDCTGGGWQGFVVGPATQEQIALALNLTCHALISCLAAFGQLIGNSEDDQKLFDLNKEYKALAGIGA